MPNFVVFLALSWLLSAQNMMVMGYSNAGTNPSAGDFVRVTKTGDGRRQTVVSSGRFLAIEDAEVGYGPGQLYVQRMTDGQEMLVQIFKGRGNLVACERSLDDVTQFRQSYLNGTKTSFQDVEHEPELSKLLERHPDIDEFLVNWEASRRACLRLQAAKQHEAHRLQKVIDEDEVERKTDLESEEVKARSRSRRAISLMWPGTTWCGVGNVSKDNDQTEGVQVETDKCCRQHDLCDYTIEGFTKKYNMFNFRFHTISHCECDDRFRTCLRMASNTHSDGIGRLFFNILGMKCFVFEREKVCKERTWYGRCILHGYQHTAVLRDSVPYYDE